MKNALGKVVHLSRADVKRLGVSGLMALGFTAAQAHAALDAAVTTAIATMSTDAVSLALLMLGAIIAVVAIKFLRKGI